MTGTYCISDDGARVVKASEIIRRTKEVLFEYGWAQDDFEQYDDVGNVVGLCVLGGARVAQYGYGVGYDFDCVADWYFQRALNGMGYVPVDDAAPVAGWNDEPVRTLTEVMDLLDRAEKLALIDEEA